MGSRYTAGGRPGGSLTPRKIQTLEMVRKIEKFLRRGYSSQWEIAVALGIPQRRVSYYIRYIYDKWRKEAPEEYARKITVRIRQLENIMQEAYLAYDKSKRGEETQSWITRPCSACAGAEDVQGNGMAPDAACSECNGTGKVTTMHAAIKDSAGDPAYLKVAQDCIKQCAHLETLLLNGGSMRPQKIEITGAVGLINVQVPQQYAGVAADKLLEARAMLQQLAADPSIGAVDGQVVRKEVESG